MNPADIVGPILSAGMKLLFTRKPFLGRRRGNFLIGFFNAFMRAEIKRGQSDAIIIGSDKIIFQLKESAVSSGSAVPLQRYRIIGIASDHVQCVTFDGTTSGPTVVNVAKQSNVRKSIVNEIYIGLNWAVTYTGNLGRTLTHAATGRTIQQSLFPTYETNGTVQNGQLWAARVEGGTGVAAAPEWLEMGPSRRWETIFKEYEVCISQSGTPVTKHALITSGELYT